MNKRSDNHPPSQKTLEALEAHLAGALQPVVPPKNFPQRLKRRISIPERREIVNRLHDWKRLFLAFSSVMTGMLLAITIARALYFLVGRSRSA